MTSKCTRRWRAAGSAATLAFLFAVTQAWARPFVFHRLQGLHLSISWPDQGGCAGFRVPRSRFTARGAFDLGSIVSGVLGDEDEDESIEVPKDVSEVVSGIKASTENTLNKAISRLEIELPPAYELGVEGQKIKGRLLGDKMSTTQVKEVARSDRELARIVVEMMQPVGDGLVVAFRTRKLAKRAEKEWKLTPGEATIISFPERVKSAFSEEVGAPIRFRKEVKEAGCLCLVVVAPYLDQLRIINDLSKDVQDSMGIILINARIHGKGRKTLKLPRRLKEELCKTFEPSYHIRFLDIERKNSLLFRMMGKDQSSPWIVAQQRELIGGQPTTQEVLRTDQEPSKAEIDKAFEVFDKREKGAMDTLIDLVDKDKISR